MTIRQILAERMGKMGLSANELARRSGVPQPTITRILTGHHQQPNTLTVNRLARSLRLRPSQLRGEEPLENGKHGNVAPGPEVYAVPLLNPEQPGRAKRDWRAAEPPAVYTTIKVGAKAYALRVVGDSMENPMGRPTFPDGCIVVLDPGRAVGPGAIVAARLDGVEQVVLKQIVLDAGKQYLRSLNPRYTSLIPVDGKVTLCGTWVQTIIDAP